MWTLSACQKYTFSSKIFTPTPWGYYYSVEFCFSLFNIPFTDSFFCFPFFFGWWVQARCIEFSLAILYIILVSMFLGWGFFHKKKQGNPASRTKPLMNVTDDGVLNHVNMEKDENVPMQVHAKLLILTQFVCFVWLLVNWESKHFTAAIAIFCYYFLVHGLCLFQLIIDRLYEGAC